MEDLKENVGCKRRIAKVNNCHAYHYLAVKKITSKEMPDVRKRPWYTFPLSQEWKTLSCDLGDVHKHDSQGFYVSIKPSIDSEVKRQAVTKDLTSGWKVPWYTAGYKGFHDSSCPDISYRIDDRTMDSFFMVILALILFLLKGHIQR